MLIPNGDGLTLNIDELFKDDTDASSPLVLDADKKVDLTAAMSKRLNEVKTKTEQETRDKIAKSLGFETYEAMEKAKTKKEIAEAGLDPDEVEKIIGPLLEKRLASDPRMQKLQQLEAQEKKAAMAAELAEIEKLTGLKVTEADLSPETLELASKGIKLSQAYIAANPAKIIGATTKGSTDHLATGNGNNKTKVRGLTAEERAWYKSINPYVTDEELNKKTLEVK